MPTPFALLIAIIVVAAACLAFLVVATVIATVITLIIILGRLLVGLLRRALTERLSVDQLSGRTLSEINNFVCYLRRQLVALNNDKRRVSYKIERCADRNKIALYCGELERIESLIRQYKCDYDRCLVLLETRISDVRDMHAAAELMEKTVEEEETMEETPRQSPSARSRQLTKDMEAVKEATDEQLAAGWIPIYDSEGVFTLQRRDKLNINTDELDESLNAKLLHLEG